MIALAKPDTCIPLDTVLHGDALEMLRTLDDNSVHSIVCDPPAGISFMNKAFDSDRGGRDQWVAWLASIMREAMRCLAPGGHALVWALPRTSHWTALALEDAGWEIRDCVYSIFGSGFPKSLDISKAIDKHLGKERTGGEREWSGGQRSNGIMGNNHGTQSRTIYDEPATEAAAQWQGWGSALKPAVECWWLCRKPLAEPSIAANVLKYGTGGLNVDKCRVGWEPGGMDGQERTSPRISPNPMDWGKGEVMPRDYKPNTQGRFPSHLLLSHSPLCIMKRVNNTAPNSVSIPIVKDTKNLVTHAGESSINEHITLSHTGSSVLFGVDLKNDIQRGKKEVYYERTLFSDDDMLVNEVDTSISQPVSNSKLSSGNGECLSTGIGGTTALREVSGIGYSTDNLTLPRAIDTPISAINSTDMSLKGLATNGASASLLAGAVTTSEDIGTFTGASDTMTELQFSIGNTIDSSTNGTSSIMPGHSSDLHLNDIHYLTSELDSQEQVDAYECHESCPIRALDEQSGVRKSGKMLPTHQRNGSKPWFTGEQINETYGDTGGASRYFQNFPPDDFTPFTYQSKASRRERNAGCEGLPEKQADYQVKHSQWNIDPRHPDGGYPVAPTPPLQNSHPTVKPLALMRWLIRLITPPGGVVLDCFLGSGSTAVAAIHEGVHFIGIEQDASYVAICEARIAHAMTHEPEVVKVATKKVKGDGHKTTAPSSHNGHGFFGNDKVGTAINRYNDPDGMEEVEDWDCHESCPIRILGEQSGERSSRPGKTKKRGESDLFGQWGNSDDGVKYAGDTGSAARYFQQFPPDSLFAEVE